VGWYRVDFVYWTDAAKISLFHPPIQLLYFVMRTFLKDIHVHFSQDDYETINFKDRSF